MPRAICTVAVVVRQVMGTPRKSMFSFGCRKHVVSPSLFRAHWGCGPEGWLQINVLKMTEWGGTLKLL